MLAPAGYGLLPVLEAVPEALSRFDCGKPHLSAFLSESAAELHGQRLGATSVVFHQNYTGVVGYFTLANDSLPLNTSEYLEMGIEQTMTSCPAVKIGRLAVASDLQGCGVGAAIMGLILGVVNSHEPGSARLLIVDADNDPKVVRFYEKQGFERSMWAEQRARHHRQRVATVKMHRDLLKL